MMKSSAHADTFEPGALDRYGEAWAHPGSLTAMLNYYRASSERPHDAQSARLTPSTLILWAKMVEGAATLPIAQPERIPSRIVT